MNNKTELSKYSSEIIIDAFSSCHSVTERDIHKVVNVIPATIYQLQGEELTPQTRSEIEDRVTRYFQSKGRFW